MSSKFIEYVAVDRNQYQDMVAELDQLRKQQQQPLPSIVTVENKPNNKPIIPAAEVARGMDIELVNLIQSLPPRSRDPAKQLLKHLLNGREFGFDISSGEILRYLPEKGYRYRVHGSNLYDILNALCKQAPPPMPQQQINCNNNSAIPDGMKTMLDMLVLTPLGSTQIVDVNLRKLFQIYRKNKTLPYFSTKQIVNSSTRPKALP